MIKIAHIADCHLGLGYPGPTPTSRFLDIVTVMDFIADRLIEEEVDICLFAGDAFKDSKVMLDRAKVEIAAFYGWMNKLADHGIDVVTISGTPSHDAVAAYELMDEITQNTDYTHIYATPGIANRFGYEGMAISNFRNSPIKLNVVCLPGMNRSNIVTREEYRGLSPQEIHRLMTDKITDITQGLRTQIGNDWPTILLAHLTYSDADTGFDQLLMENEPILTPQAVQGFDLVCLGHIHKAQQIGAQNVFYAGSPERLSFNEEGFTPGFWIHEIEEKGDPVESRFISTPAREYWTLNYSHNPAEGALSVEHLINGLGTWDVKDTIVRMRVKATEEQAKLLDRKRIESDLYEAGAFFVQEIRIESERSDRARDKEVTETMGPVDAVEKWCVQQGKDAEEVDSLKSLAARLLEEVRS